MIRKWVPVWVIPVVVVMAVITVWLRLAIVGTTYSIHQADKEIRELKQERDRVELKFAGQRSPRKLEVMARGRFGLSQPKSDQVVHLK